MMDKKQIAEAVLPLLEEMGCFLVDVKVSTGNDIEIAIEKHEGVVVMEDCVRVDEFIHGRFSQDEEDYALTVTSAGLDRPFKVREQFVKAVGTKVTVSLKGGRRFVATILEVTDDGIRVAIPTGEETLAWTDLTTVVPYIEFK